MSSPKSFKDMIKRHTLKPQPQPLKLIPQPKLSDAEITQRKNKLAEMKKFANTLRCPLCQAQLDGGVSHLEAKLYCVSDPSEYTVWYPGRGLPKREAIRISNEFITYEIVHFLLGINDEEIPIYEMTVYEMDRTIPRLDIREKMKKRIFYFSGIKFLPINNNLTVENLFKKLEIYQIFQ